MAITTIYKCDKCGHEQDNSDQMRHLGISLQSHTYPTSTPIVMSCFYCRKCVEDLGLLPYIVERKKKTKYAEPKPTMEDIVKDIIQTINEEGK